MMTERKTNKISTPEELNPLVKNKLEAIKHIVESWSGADSFPNCLENQEKWEKADFIQFFLKLQERLYSLLIASSGPYCTACEQQIKRTLAQRALARTPKQPKLPNLLESWRESIKAIALCKSGDMWKASKFKPLFLAFIDGCLNPTLSCASKQAFETSGEDWLNDLDVGFQSLFFLLVATIKQEQRTFAAILAKK